MIGSVPLNNTGETLVFGPVVLTSDHITGATGISLTVTVSKNGAAFAAPVGAVSEVGNGFYAIAANALDANTIGVLVIHATGAGCDVYDDWYDVVDEGLLTAPATPAPSSSLTSVNLSAQSLISGALKLIGVLAAGETLQAQDAEDGFSRLNELIDSWGTQRQTMFTIGRHVYPLVSGTRDYTLGPGGTFNQARPQWIEGAAILITTITPNIEIPIPVFTDDQWRELPIKTLESGWVTGVYVDFADASLLATLSTYPTLNAGSLSLVLYTPTAVTQFATLTTLYSLPPGYAKALRYNLAIQLAPEYGVLPTPLVLQGAAESLADIKRANLRLNELSIPVPLWPHVGASNIYTGP